MTTAPPSTPTAQTPIISPVLQLLHSRRFLISVVYLVISLIVTFRPELAAVRNELLIGISGVAALLIHGYSLTDVANAARDRAGQPPMDWQSSLLDIFSQLLGVQQANVTALAQAATTIQPSTIAPIDIKAQIAEAIRDNGGGYVTREELQTSLDHFSKSILEGLRASQAKESAGATSADDDLVQYTSDSPPTPRGSSLIGLAEGSLGAG